jgi:hypothetical protein
VCLSVYCLSVSVNGLTCLTSTTSHRDGKQAGSCSAVLLLMFHSQPSHLESHVSVTWSCVLCLRSAKSVHCLSVCHSLCVTIVTYCRYTRGSCTVICGHKYQIIFTMTRREIALHCIHFSVAELMLYSCVCYCWWC